ncbi:MAG TPA: energy transducer TonB [Variovorax sp.]|nr:energy transducer TonB [Variovorax sp.]
MKPGRLRWRQGGATLALLACAPLGAQPQAPASAPTEQAKRLADSPFRWIMINGAIKDKKAGKTTPSKPGEATAAAAPKAPPPQVEPPAEPLVLAEPPQAAASMPVPAAAASAKAPAEPPALRIVKQVLPEPPERLIASEGDDRVMVQFIVLPDGSVTGVKVASSTNVRLNPHVVSAVEQWRYAEIEVPRNAQAGFVFRR